MFSVCADDSVVRYFCYPVCRGDLRFLYCDDVRLCCTQEMLKFFHGAPYAVCVELKNFYLFVFCFGGILFVSCVGVCGCEELGWRRMEVWVVVVVVCHDQVRCQIIQSP